jgi:hypothetical protein
MCITYSQFLAYIFPISNKFLKFMIQQAIHRLVWQSTSCIVHRNIFHSVPKHSSCCSEEGEAQLLSVSLCCLSMPHSEFFSFLGRFFVIHRQGFTEVRVTGAEQEDRDINRRHRSLFEVARGSLATVCLQGFDIPILGSCKQFQAS